MNRLAEEVRPNARTRLNAIILENLMFPQVLTSLGGWAIVDGVEVESDWLAR